ncbi:MAG TPA: hypothetical protein VIL30_27140, partial [Ramlibacter sp.]
SFTRGNEPGRLALSQAMMQSLGAFAGSGDPGASGQPAWPAWPMLRVFDADAARAELRTESVR